MAPRTDPEYLATKRRRKRAFRSMQALTGLCVVVALGLGGYQLHSEGLSGFLDRPPGIGATPQDDQPDGGTGASTSAPNGPTVDVHHVFTIAPAATPGAALLSGGG